MKAASKLLDPLAWLVERSRGLHRDRGGQISFIAVFGAVALVALLAMVITTGDQAARKIRLQNAADEAALAGGMFIARGMNLLSAFNVLETQLASGAILLQALDEALEELRERVSNLNGFYSVCAPFSAFCAQAAQITALQLQVLDALIPLIDQLTQVLASCRYGLFWTVAEGLEGLSELVVFGMGWYAEEEARTIAEMNGAEDVEFLGLAFGASPGVLRGVAGLPLPVRKGSSGDQCDPMVNGSPQERQRGYQPFLGYPLETGPFTLGKRRIRRFLRPLTGFPPVGAGKFNQNAEKRLRELCAGADDDGCRLPAPYLLRQEEDALSFLLVARKANRRSFFTGDFVAAPPEQVTYAQVEIYNGLSTDTYTQDWRARLAPASLAALAGDRLGSGLGAVPFLDDLNNH